MEYRYGSHSVFNIEYHFVWVTKYRYKVLVGDVALRVRELVRQSCQSFEIQIISGVVSKDHVHLFVSAPPTMAPSEIMRRVKGDVQASYLLNFLTCANVFGAAIFGLEVIFAQLPAM